jgi:hypothetical protein
MVREEGGMIECGLFPLNRRDSILPDFEWNDSEITAFGANDPEVAAAQFGHALCKVLQPVCAEAHLPRPMIVGSVPANESPSCRRTVLWPPSQPATNFVEISQVPSEFERQPPHPCRSVAS